ncbi:alpha/beta fold hydrolase [Proteobacteria bacterium 005FR1]|nr:alpha/beta fold hydrolase [Proteobacteria bacterium 005FR1]
MMGNRSFLGVTLSVLLVLTGGWLASRVQSSSGDVDIQDVRFDSAQGATMSGLLYRPERATERSPAPAVLAVHGYINSRETQSPYAIELARRGYVVLALDQRGHGYSDPPAFAEGFGGPAGLSYLQQLAFVDDDQIVLSGHSMGGWTVLSAATAFPDAYRSIVISGSSTGTFGVPEGTATYPRNLGLVFGQYDEFSQTMWGSATGRDIVVTDKLKKLFGSKETVQAGQLYGSIAEGTARKLYQPAHTHPANHITASGVAAVIDWVQSTSNAPKPLSPADQIWQWKEFGTFLSLIGGIAFLVIFGGLLLNLPPFARELNQRPAKAVGLRGASWWLSSAIFVAVPALTFFPLQLWGGSITASAWLPQRLTTGFVAWAVGTGLISIALFSLWHFRLGGKAGGGNAVSYGLTWATGNTAKRALYSLGLAILTVAGLYLLLALNHLLFTTDFRIWVIAVKLLSPLQWGIFLVYLLPFVAFFFVTGLVLHGQLRGSDERSTASHIGRNMLLMGMAMAMLLTVQYLPLFMGGTLLLADQALLTIVALQFVALLPVAGLISTYFFQRSGHLYIGAIINGLFFTWLIVAGQATHYAF